MKLKRLQFKQILKLHLLKYRTYEQSININAFNPVTDSTLNKIIVNLKKILQVIFQYHSINKRILFIGLPKKLELKINKVTNHVAVPKDFKIEGIISNNFQANVKADKQESKYDLLSFKYFFPKLSKKPDLVVVVSHDKQQNILKECFVAKIPVINFKTEYNSKDLWLIYSHNVGLNNNNLNLVYNKNFFFMGLNFLFKPSKTNNKRFRSKLAISNIKRSKKKSFQK